MCGLGVSETADMLWEERGREGGRAVVTQVRRIHMRVVML